VAGLDEPRLGIVLCIIQDSLNPRLWIDLYFIILKALVLAYKNTVLFLE